LKLGTEFESLSDLNTSDTSNSFKYAKKKIKKRKKNKEPTENHLKIRAVVDAGREWELDLERVHGFTDEEACVCVSIVAKYLPKGKFPPSNGDRYGKHAEEGWGYVKELRRLKKLYPECSNQTSTNGEWTML
jgi:hypothetical protein